MFFHRSGVPLMIIYVYLSMSSRKKEDEDEDDDEDENAVKEEDGEEDGEEEGEEEEEEDAAGPRADAQPELTRVERRELKKKQAAEKQAQKQLDHDDKDVDLINPNHIEKKLNISDLGSKELTRKER